MSAPTDGWVVDRHGGPGAVVVHVPHAATEIPPAVRAGLVLDDGELEAELDALTDWHTDALAAAAVDRAGIAAVVFRNRLARLVVDPERLPDDREVMAARGMGAVYTVTSQLAPLREPDPAVEAALLDRYFHPYAAALADEVDRVLAEVGRCVLVDLHSYPSAPLPYELDAAALRPGICIGTDAAHTPDWLRAAASDAFGDDPGGVGFDTPFAGSYVPLRHLGRDQRVSSVMIEIRRDRYVDEPSTVRPDGFAAVADELASLLTAVDAVVGAR